jgi:hypothetical protein
MKTHDKMAGTSGPRSHAAEVETAAATAMESDQCAASRPRAQGRAAPTAWTHPTTAAHDVHPRAPPRRTAPVAIAVTVPSPNVRHRDRMEPTTKARYGIDSIVDL